MFHFLMILLVELENIYMWHHSFKIKKIYLLTFRAKTEILNQVVVQAKILRIKKNMKINQELILDNNRIDP